MGNRKRRRQAKPKADLRWRTCRVGVGVLGNHRVLGEGLWKAQHMSLEWTKGPLALPWISRMKLKFRF